VLRGSENTHVTTTKSTTTASTRGMRSERR
jgi:hypothetical protein